MRKFLFGLLMACAASVNAADYFSVTMDVDVNGNPVAHSAIVEIGKKIQVTSESLDNSKPSIRLDYTIDKIGSDDKGEAIAHVSGMIFSLEGDSVWSLASDFKFAVKMGDTISIETENNRYLSNINFNVSAISEEQIIEKFGKIPEASSCNAENDLLADAVTKNGADSDCCYTTCRAIGSNRVKCCGGRRCCANHSDPECCCTRS